MAKAPGMLWIAISFLLWILYRVFSGLGNPAGVMGLPSLFPGGWRQPVSGVGAPPRPYFKTPVKGLYLAGASTFPGGGIEATVISGIITANDSTGREAPGSKAGRGEGRYVF